MTFFKNLNRNKKKLYRLAYELGLTEWHWTACQILLQVNGYKNAEDYLRKAGTRRIDLSEENCT